MRVGLIVERDRNGKRCQRQSYRGEGIQGDRAQRSTETVTILHRKGSVGGLQYRILLDQASSEGIAHQFGVIRQMKFFEKTCPISADGFYTDG
jgi:hypothetical protein